MGFINPCFIFFDGWFEHGLSGSKVEPIDDLFLFVVNFLATVPTRLSYLLKKNNNNNRDRWLIQVVSHLGVSDSHL